MEFAPAETKLAKPSNPFVKKLQNSEAFSPMNPKIAENTAINPLKIVVAPFTRAVKPSMTKVKTWATTLIIVLNIEPNTVKMTPSTPLTIENIAEKIPLITEYMA